MNEYIKVEDCVHGNLYRLCSRNLAYGVFRAASVSFVGIRTKFGAEGLSTELHWDSGPPCGTARPLALVCPCPIEDLTESLVVIDGAGDKVWRKNQALFDWLKEQTKQKEA